MRASLPWIPRTSWKANAPARGARQIYTSNKYFKQNISFCQCQSTCTKFIYHKFPVVEFQRAAAEIARARCFLSVINPARLARKIDLTGVAISSWPNTRTEVPRWQHSATFATWRIEIWPLAAVHRGLVISIRRCPMQTARSNLWTTNSAKPCGRTRSRARLPPSRSSALLRQSPGRPSRKLLSKVGCDRFATAAEPYNR